MHCLTSDRRNAPRRMDLLRALGRHVLPFYRHSIFHATALIGIDESTHWPATQRLRCQVDTQKCLSCILPSTSKPSVGLDPVHP